MCCKTLVVQLDTARNFLHPKLWLTKAQITEYIGIPSLEKHLSSLKETQELQEEDFAPFSMETVVFLNQNV